MLPDVERLGADALAHQLADEEIEADAMAADDDEVGGLESLRRGAAPRPSLPASTISVCWSIVMKPSAPLNVVTEPEPLPIG